MTTKLTLYDAINAFLGPLAAEYGLILDEGDDDMPVTISLGKYEHKTTLGVIKDLDRAHQRVFDEKCRKQSKKAVGSLL